jgi:hypothetical protein
MAKQGKVKRGGRAAWQAAGMLLAMVLLLGLAVQPVVAQTYRFSVPESTADVYANEDGTATVEYTYLFENSTSADPIDIVDVGTPTSSYDLGSVTATINGQPVQRIAESQYVDPGVEIHLGANEIRPGDRGELRVRIGTVKRILFKASQQESEPYASFQFQPNFYGSEFVSGRTKMTVTLHLPPGLKENEPRYFTPKNWPGSAEPESGYDADNRVFYRWTTENASSSSAYVFGASFPARMVPASALLTETPAWLSSQALCPVIFCLGFAGFLAFTIWAAINGDRKRKLQYLPPKVAVEGNGIKRGLTAVEAALIMQQPMDKILTMILFSVVKKGVAKVVTRDPMKLDISDPLPEDLRTYEAEFLQAMKLEKPGERRRGLQNMMTGLVKSLSEKMRGFSRKETMAYYQDIMNKAWQQVEQAQTPEMKMQMFDEAMDWTMLDKNFDNHTQTVFGPRPVFVPVWWGNYDPTFRPTASQSTGGGLPSIPSAGNRPPTGVNLPNLPGSDFAASMVAGMQSFASNVVGDVASFTGGVTEKTNPVPKPTYTPGSGRGGGGGGGGRSCACACACAGCACACAGGGR